MAPPIDPRDPVSTHTRSQGRCYLYVLPCAYEDLLKLGHSRDPLARMQALHPRYFEVFDLERAFLVETETVREAQALELSLGRALALHNAPAPLTVRLEAAGHTEWYRGAYQLLSDAAKVLSARGHALHDPLHPWLRQVLLARRDLLFSWSEAMLTWPELEARSIITPGQLVVRDALDAYDAFGIDLEPWLPEAVLRWHRAVSGAVPSSFGVPDDE